MNNMNDNNVNYIYQCSLLHDTLNISNSYYSPTLHVFMNTHKGTIKYKTFEFH